MIPWKLVGLLMPCFYIGVGLTIGFCAKEYLPLVLHPVPKKKKADEDKETNEFKGLANEGSSRNAFLLSTKFRPGILSILNKCDPESFVRMSMTCKGIRTICLNSKEISVEFPCRIVWTRGISDETGEFYGPCVRFKYMHNYKGRRVIYGRQLENLKRLPFHFQIHIKFKGILLMEEDIDLIYTFISNFPKFSIAKIFIRDHADVDCWPKLVEYFKKYPVGHLIANTSVDNVTLKSLLQLNFDNLELDRSIPRGMMWLIGAKKLFIKGSNVNAEDFKDILDHISRDEVPIMTYWRFNGLHGSLLSPEGFKNLFTKFSTELPFSYEGEISSTRPLISFYYDETCYLLTRGNVVVRFTIYDGFLTIARSARYGEFINDVPKPFRSFYTVDKYTK